MDTTTTNATTTNATAPAAAAATTCAILALDLGKYKTVACLYDGDPAAARFHTLDTSREELRKLCARHRPAVVVIEACTLAGWVHDLCAELGLTCRVANTASEAWKFKHAKRKTDKDDALRLAQLRALGQLPTVTVPPVQTRQWRALIAGRQDLLGRRVAVQNRVRALFVGQGLPAPRGHRAWTATGLEGIGRHARPLAECGPDELWRGLLDLALAEYRHLRALLAQAEAKLEELARRDEGVRLLETVPGVGTRTAEVVAAYLGDAKRFDNGKQVSAYAGLVPRQFQSGQSDRRGRITRRGPAVLRKALVECAWMALRYNGWARAVYARLSRGRARKKQAIVALARKLLVRCWAMLRDRAPWREGVAAAAPT
jgi:transposase